MNSFLVSLDIGSALLYGTLVLLLLRSKDDSVRKQLPVAVFVGALTLQFSGFVLRWSIAGYPPVVAWQHAILFSTMLAMGFLLLENAVSGKWRNLLPVAASYAALLCLWAGLSPASLSPLPLSLRSGWLFIHASAAALGQAAFFTGAAASTTRILGSYSPRFSSHAPLMEELSIRAMIAAVLFWGAMIIGGALWADDAWGRYWGWDPVEVWSLLIWLLAALHVHIYFGWKSLHGNFLAIYAILLMVLARFALFVIAALHQTIHWYGR
ncbi:MAG: cytochrome c biogenesis protein CcsA [Bacteroidota bacterium]